MTDEAEKVSLFRASQTVRIVKVKVSINLSLDV